MDLQKIENEAYIQHMKIVILFYFRTKLLFLESSFDLQTSITRW